MFSKQMRWDLLLDDTRLRRLLAEQKSHKVPGDSRTEYERDRDRTIYSSPFRRLIRKTQVFPLDPNDLVRTRLVHSLEVSTVAEGLASQTVRDVISRRERLNFEASRAISKIAETCGLLHDLGNPPFGHAGELAISSWFERTETGKRLISKLYQRSKAVAADFYRFEGNAQTLRIVTNSHLLANDHGLNLTCATVAALRKYLRPAHESDENSRVHEATKPGYFQSEAKILHAVAKRTGTVDRRHPVTYLVEAADDIVYSVVDLEDGMKKRLLTWKRVRQELEERCPGSSVLREALRGTDEQMKDCPLALREADYPQAFRVNAISAMVRAVVHAFDVRYTEIMKGRYHQELLYDCVCEAASLVDACKKLLRDTVFRDTEVLRLEIRGRKVIHDLMELFWEGIETYLKDRKTHTKSYGGKLYLIMSEGPRHIFETRLNRGMDETYCALQLLTDYISGMTDGFASRLHSELMNG